MKKLFAIIMTACLLASLLCVTAFAADAPAEDVVLRVSALKKDDTTVVIKDYTVFEDGWNAAMELAVNSKELNKNDYARVIVDIYADWNANENGEFTKEFFNGKGFNWDAIYFQPNVRMTLNLNGHTINRGLTENEYNGEVMYIDEDAEVIINDGTITGGNSDNGAGGIHIDGARVTLNNVNIVGNIADGDNGAGIALYDCATLKMNGGSIADNINDSMVDAWGAGIYAANSTVILEGVTLRNNQFMSAAHSGAAIALNRSNLTMNDCSVIGNGTMDNARGTVGSLSTIDCGAYSEVDIKNTSFTGNGIAAAVYSTTRYTALLNVVGPVSLESCTVTGNTVAYLLKAMSKNVSISDSTFTDNNANVYLGYADDYTTFTNCTFNHNTGSSDKGYDSFYFETKKSGVIFTDCEFGDSTFNDRSFATFVESSRGKSVGSIFGDGSIATIVSLVALMASIAAISVSVASRKKSASAKNDDEE